MTAQTPPESSPADITANPSLRPSILTHRWGLKGSESDEVHWLARKNDQLDQNPASKLINDQSDAFYANLNLS